MNMTERIALILLVAATPLMGQFSGPDEGPRVTVEGAEQPGLSPSARQEINYDGKKPQAGVGGGVQGDTGGQNNDKPVVFGPVSETASMTYIFRWERYVEVTCFTNVSGKVEGDISGGLGFGAAAAEAEAKCLYGGIEVKSADDASIAITTIGTPMIHGRRITIFGYETTVFLDTKTRQVVPLADSDPGPEKCTRSVIVHFKANGHAAMTLYKPAKGSFSYEAKAGALILVHGFCPFHYVDADVGGDR